MWTSIEQLGVLVLGWVTADQCVLEMLKLYI